jgi:hypothetical protein
LALAPRNTSGHTRIFRISNRLSTAAAGGDGYHSRHNGGKNPIISVFKKKTSGSNGKGKSSFF